MRTFIGDQQAFSAFEFAELSLGLDRELFAGVPGETPEERAPRLDVAREVLRDLRETDPQAAAYAEELMRTAPLPLTAVRKRGAIRTEVRAA